MKVRAPHAVQVGPKVFTIKYQPMVVHDGDEVCGYCDGPGYEILLSLTENHSKDALFSTLFHETVHAIWYVTGQADTLKEPNIEEGVTVAMENFLGEAINWKHPMWKEWKVVKLKGEPDVRKN